MKFILCTLFAFCFLQIKSQQAIPLPLPVFPTLPAFPNDPMIAPGYLPNDILTCPMIWPNDNMGLNMNAVDTSYREKTAGDIDYVLQFVYNPMVSMVPLTYPPGQPHYDADITVYRHTKHKIKTDTSFTETISLQNRKGKWAQIGNSFSGQYTANGCFEDVTENIIMQAYKSVKGLSQHELDLYYCALHPTDTAAAIKAKGWGNTGFGGDGFYIDTVNCNIRLETDSIIIYDGDNKWKNAPLLNMSDTLWFDTLSLSTLVDSMTSYHLNSISNCDTSRIMNPKNTQLVWGTIGNVMIPSPVLPEPKFDTIKVVIQVLDYAPYPKDEYFTKVIRGWMIRETQLTAWTIGFLKEDKRTPVEDRINLNWKEIKW